LQVQTQKYGTITITIAANQLLHKLPKKSNQKNPKGGEET
jgi:hypothetical protein